MIRLTLLPALAALLPAAAGAQDAPMPLGYETFEFAVPHIDLAECPAELAQETRFCRATLHSEEFHVFAFSREGDQPLVGYAAFPADGVGAILTRE
jgi:hypothetical protein